jgi:sorbitol/mannitol transport system substrate-binding protein
MWVDATVAAAFVSDPKQSKVANDVAFAQAPCAVTCKDANWLWAWSLAIPASSKKQEAAEKFISWATDKAYAQLVASKDGWANVPPGTRKSLYDNPEYLKAAPFAKPTLAAIDSANPGLDGTLKPKPYIGVQFAAIPEFQGIATAVGQQFAAALTGQMTAAQALANAQRLTEREMRRGGYMQ